jgi:AhpD family alkylhydroperoxidase
VVSDSTLPAATQELVRLRASQINGCGFCTDMHTKDAAHAGETSVRLNLVAAIALINAFNRLNVIVQQPAGDYQPGQFG